MSFAFNNQDQFLKYPEYEFKLIETDGIQFLQEDISKKNKNKGLIYNPLTYKGTYKTPRTPNENLSDSGDVALSNLNINDNEAILRFVNTWGLLGLNNVKFFEELSFEERRGIPYQDLFRSNTRARREPLFLFKMASEHYQRLIDLIYQWEIQKEHLIPKEIEKLDFLSLVEAIKANINQIISNHSPFITFNKEEAEFESTILNNSKLYGFIYALAIEDLLKGTGLQRCSRPNCKAYFRPTRSDRKYCSMQCNDAVRSAYQRTKKQAIKELSIKNNSVSKEKIKDRVNQIAKPGYLTKEEIIKKYYLDD